MTESEAGVQEWVMVGEQQWDDAWSYFRRRFQTSDSASTVFPSLTRKNWKKDSPTYQISPMHTHVILLKYGSILPWCKLEQQIRQTR